MDEALKKDSGYGNFGNLSKKYDEVRKGFPNEVIDLIFQKIGKEKPFILDIGCGTGIATKQLHDKGATAVGTDIDAHMIQEAQVDKDNSIDYQVASADTQPFQDNTFDAVTAFSAFHWFSTKETLEEIKRILKPGGVFFAINKNEVGDFKRKNKEILQQFVTQSLPDIKKEYNPKKILEENGYREIEEKIISVTERFTVPEAVDYIQTMSVWNLVPEEVKGVALDKLTRHFQQTEREGFVDRELAVHIVFGSLKIVFSRSRNGSLV